MWEECFPTPLFWLVAAPAAEGVAGGGSCVCVSIPAFKAVDDNMSQ